MAVYKYPESTLVDEVTFKKTAKGGVRAYLHARAGAPVEEVDRALEALIKKGYECIPFDMNGVPTLEVRGFQREGKLIKELRQENLFSGPTVIEKSDEEKIGWKEKLKERALQVSGLFYVVGDFNFFGYGQEKKSLLNMLAGTMYAGGTYSLLRYGRNDQSDIQVRDLAKDIIGQMVSEGADIPNDHSLHHLVENRKQSPIQAIDNHFRHYPSEMFNLFTGLAGACIAAAAYKELRTKPNLAATVEEIKNMNKEHWLDVGLGTITIASTAYGALAKEKAHDPDAPKHHGVKAVIDWVQERPLTVSAAGLLVSTMCHAVSTGSAYKRALKKKDFAEIPAINKRATFVATNLAAELLIAISSKGHGEGVVSDKSVDHSAVAITAELIAKEPQEMREGLIQHMGEFLGSQKILAMDDKEVTELLRSQVSHMCENPWAKSNGGTLQEAEAVQKPTTPEQIVAASEDKPTVNWQAKMAQSKMAAQAAAPQPGV